jgi:holo-[acyl-carrier protein] synthase
VIVGVGIDLVETRRVARALARWGPRLVGKLMDPQEARRLPDGEARAFALAVAVGLKEAASKAIGTGWSRGVRWRDVVVDPGPPPRVRLEARAAEFAERLGSCGDSECRVEERDGLVIAQVRLLS